MAGSRLQAWISLLRVANLPGAASNILVGYLLVAGDWNPLGMVLAAILASLLFYSAGILSNDLADLERDRVLRPERPLPSGAVEVATARTTHWILFGLGMAVCFGIDLKFGTGLRGASFSVSATGGMLVLAILLYNLVLKRFLVSALAMGLCRGLNLLLGMAVAAGQGGRAGEFTGGWHFGGILAGLVLFVCGLTLLARDESEPRPRRWLLAAGTLCMATGLLLYALLPVWMDRGGLAVQPRDSRNHLLLIAVIGFTVLRSACVATVTLRPEKIRGAVKTALFSLVTLDAAVALLASGGQAFFALIVLGMTGVSLLLSRFSNPT